MERIDRDMVRLTEAILEEPDIAQRCTVPGYPYIGEDYQIGAGVSFIGKANYRWPPPEHSDFCGEPVGPSQAALWDYWQRVDDVQELLRESKRVGEEFRMDRVAGYYGGSKKSQSARTQDPGYHSPWWKFVVEFTAGILERRSDLPRYQDLRSGVLGALKSIHTSNLFKVAWVEANPTDELVRVQLDAGEELLRNEFEMLDPRLVVFPIGSSYPKSRERMLPGWSVIAEHELDGAAIKEITWDGFDGIGIQMRHPQGAKREFLSAVYRWAHRRY